MGYRIHRGALGQAKLFLTLLVTHPDSWTRGRTSEFISWSVSLRLTEGDRLATWGFSLAGEWRVVQGMALL